MRQKEPNGDWGYELVRKVTVCVRRADIGFEKTGGSSRHWVREQLLNELEKEGLMIVEEHESTKQPELPAVRIVPDWVEWFTLDANGEGLGHLSKPRESDGDFWFCSGEFVILLDKMEPELMAKMCDKLLLTLGEMLDWAKQK